MERFRKLKNKLFRFSRPPPMSSLLHNNEKQGFYSPIEHNEHQEIQQTLKTDVRNSATDGVFISCPVDIIKEILSYLTYQELCLIGFVNKWWYNLSQSPELWESLCKNDLGIIDNAIPCWKCKYSQYFNIGCWDHTQAPSQIVVSNEGRTIENSSGGWNSIPLGTHPLSRGVYQISFTVDSWPCNGMMIGISPVSHVHRYVKERYYPGSGYGGITANSDSIAFYSHDGVIFHTGDVIKVVLDMNKYHVTFYKNGERVGGESLIYHCPHFVIGSLCGTGHKLSVIKESSSKKLLM